MDMPTVSKDFQKSPKSPDFVTSDYFTEEKARFLVKTLVWPSGLFDVINEEWQRERKVINGFILHRLPRIFSFSRRKKMQQKVSNLRT